MTPSATIIDRIVALAGSTILAACASAQTPKLIWRFSTDNGLTWQSNGYANTNSTIKVRGTVDFTGVTAYGFSGLTQQIFIDNYDAGDDGAQVATNGVGNRLAPFNFGAATLAVRVTGTIQRIVALGIGGVEGNISTGQAAAAQDPINPINPAPIFQFDYKIGEIADRRLLVRSVVGTSSGVPSSFSFFASAQSSSTSFRVSGEVLDATIQIVPTGGPLSVFGTAFLGFTRRSRTRTTANAKRGEPKLAPLITFDRTVYFG